MRDLTSPVANCPVPTSEHRFPTPAISIIPNAWPNTDAGRSPPRCTVSIDVTELDEELVSVCRTAIGDEVRSITYFTPDDYDQLYLRDDLEQDADIERFAENERLGFASQQTYGNTELGEYEFTIRVFEWGYVTRVIVDDLGVFVTTDPLKMDEFREVATAVRHVLEGEHGSNGK